MRLIRPFSLSLLSAVLLTIGVTACTADTSAEKPSAASQTPNTAGRTLEEVQQSGVLRVGTITDYPPNEFKTDAGEPTGWAVELVVAIAKELGVNVEWELLLFDNIIPRVQAGAVDLGVGSFTDTVEREQVVDFVNYYEAGSLWAAPKNKSVDPDHACGLTVAAMTGGTQHLTELPKRSDDCVAAGKTAITILPFTGQPEVTQAVVQGQADAFSADSPVTIEAVTAMQGKLHLVGDMFDTAPYGFPMAKESPLEEPVKDALQRLIDNGTYQQILQKYQSESGAVASATINAAAKQ